MFCLFEKTESTLCEAGRIINSKNAPSYPFSLVALTQTKGRGRQKKPWQSPYGNLYFTFVFNQDFVNSNLQAGANVANHVSVISALALKDLLSYYIPTQNTFIKWPNDILVNKHKIAGILIEKQQGFNNKDYFLIGIGINVNVAPSVQNPKFEPTCIKNHTNKTIHVLETASLLNNLLTSYFNKYFSKELDIAVLKSSYKESLLYMGKDILVKQGNNLLQGTFTDISEEGFIVLKEKETGLLHKIPSGEILHYEN